MNANRYWGIVSHENFFHYRKPSLEYYKHFLMALFLTLKLMESRKGEPVDLNAVDVLGVIEAIFS